jgi:hypothetical protein
VPEGGKRKDGCERDSVKIARSKASLVTFFAFSPDGGAMFGCEGLDLSKHRRDLLLGSAFLFAHFSRFFIRVISLAVGGGTPAVASSIRWQTLR